jgi:hypothetical protein
MAAISGCRRAIGQRRAQQFTLGFEAVTEDHRNFLALILGQIRGY